MISADVLICTLICRRTAYVLDIFLANQREIQQAYPGCRLILATEEPDYVAELKELLERYNLRGDVITFEVKKPDYAKSSVWNITCGRESHRQYVLAHQAAYMLLMDSDMVYDPQSINILKDRISGHNAVFSGFILRHDGTLGMGGGCLMLDRDTIRRVSFRCFEFKNGEGITEDEVLDADLFQIRARVKKGIFLAIRHYRSREVFFDIVPGQISFFRGAANSLPVRYVLVRTSQFFKHNISGWLHNKLVRNRP